MLLIGAVESWKGRTLQPERFDIGNLADHIPPLGLFRRSQVQSFPHWAAVEILPRKGLVYDGDTPAAIVVRVREIAAGEQGNAQAGKITRRDKSVVGAGCFVGLGRWPPLHVKICFAPEAGK